MIPCNTKNKKKEYKILLNELKAYNPELIDKKRILAITKCDLLNEKDIKTMQKKLPEMTPVLFISSIKQQNLQQLKDEIWKLLNN
jgi:GTP-binding protein